MRIAERRLFAEDRAQDKIADQRMELGSAALEFRRGCPRQRHRRHGLAGPRVGDGLTNPVLGYSQRLHQFNLIALVLGRLKFRLSTAPFFGHFDHFFVILRELNSYLVNYCRSNFCRTAPLCGIDQSPFPRDGYGVAGGEAAGINGLRRHPTSSVPRTGRWLVSTRKLRNCQFIIAKMPDNY